MRPLFYLPFKSSMTQSFNVPDKISMNELGNYLKQAQSIESESSTFEDDVLETAYKLVYSDAMNVCIEKDQEPLLVHKAMAMIILQGMVAYHCKVADKLHADGEWDKTVGWSRDAGKFQAMLNIIRSVSVCPNDFMIDD